MIKSIINILMASLIATIALVGIILLSNYWYYGSFLF